MSERVRGGREEWGEPKVYLFPRALCQTDKFCTNSLLKIILLICTLIAGNLSVND